MGIMQISIFEKPNFQICGLSVETSLDEHNKDVSALYKSYFESNSAKQVSVLANDFGSEFYSVTWYTKGHERYRYLFGKIANGAILPSELELKNIHAMRYAIASFPKANDIQDIYNAWVDFLNTAVPNAGCMPDADGNFIEYFPKGIYGAYELWAPLVNTDV